jgi:hypothetical protein
MTSNKVPNVLFPAVRQRQLEKKLRRILTMLLEGKGHGNQKKASRAAGFSTPTYRRYEEIYTHGGEAALRRSLLPPSCRALTEESTVSRTV